MFLISSCNCLCAIYWSQVLSWEWRCSWCSADRRCSNYIWVIHNFITKWCASYIRDLTDSTFIDATMWHQGQAGKLKYFGTRPNWAVSYIAYTKFHLPRPVFHSPGQIFTRIGERASASFPACGVILCIRMPQANETMLQFSHWLGTYTKWSLDYKCISQ